jgi:hypothetical protein
MHAATDITGQDSRPFGAGTHHSPYRSRAS